MEKLENPEDLKSSAEICLRVRIPPPVPASPSRPVSLIEKRGDFFLYPVRRLDDFPPMSNHDKRFFASHTVPPIQLRCAALFPIYLPAFRPVFPRRRIGGFYAIRRAAPLFGLAGRDAVAFLLAFPFRLAGRISSRFSPRFPICPIGFSPSSSPRFPPDGSASFLFAFLYDRRGGSVFFVCIFVFPVDFAAACDTLIDIHAGVVEWQTRQI